MTLQILDNGDTIVAIATASGGSAIGIVKISGSRAHDIAVRILNRSLVAGSITYSRFQSDTGAVIDRGVALYFKAPNSYTGEDVVELQSHGNAYILDQLLQVAVLYGARPAEPGEFTRRAFLNDKMDLAQAEAVADLIASSSAEAACAATRSLSGEFSRAVNGVLQQLIDIRVYIEATMDFVEEEIDFLSDGQMDEKLSLLKSDLDGIHSRAREGSLLREGMTIVIAGVPNVGKSSLLNRLTGEESAIVTSIPGTTRDVLREQIVLDGLPVNIIDTAGLRSSEDIVELEGIKRARQQLKMADLVLQVETAGESELQTDLADIPSGIQRLLIYNKMDLCLNWTPAVSALQVSAHTGEGIEELRDQLKSHVGYVKTPEGAFMARRRHLTALQLARTHVDDAQMQLQSSRYAELAAEELRLAQLQLSSICGEFSSDDLLGEIFSSFCIGK